MKTWKEILDQRVHRDLNKSSRAVLRKMNTTGPYNTLSYFNHAEEVFKIPDGIDDDDDDIPHECYDEECDTPKFEFRSVDKEYQLALPLYSVEEEHQQLHRLIKKYEVSLEKMGECALRWRAMELAAEKNPQLNKMFMDLKMMFKLIKGDSLD